MDILESIDISCIRRIYTFCVDIYIYIYIDILRRGEGREHIPEEHHNEEDDGR